MAAGGAGDSGVPNGVPNIEFYGFVGKDEAAKNKFLTDLTSQWGTKLQIGAGTNGCVKILNIDSINYYIKGQVIGYRDKENPLGCDLKSKDRTPWSFSASSTPSSASSAPSSASASSLNEHTHDRIQHRYTKYKNEIEMNLFVTENIPTYVSKCIGGIIINKRIVYIIFEHRTGTDLEKYINNNTKIELEDIETILYKLNECIKKLHKLNILHKDINPKNIFYTDDKNILLIDFGAAQYMNKKVEDYSEIYEIGVEMFSIEVIYKSLLKKFYIEPSTENTKLNKILRIVSHNLLTFKKFKEIVFQTGPNCSNKRFLKNTYWPPEIPNSEISLSKYLTARDVISLDEMYILINNLIIAVNNVHCNYRTQNTINVDTIMCNVDKISLSGDSTLMTFENIRDNKQNIIEYQKNIFEYFSVVRYIFLDTILKSNSEYKRIEALHARLDSSYMDWYQIAFPSAAAGGPSAPPAATAAGEPSAPPAWLKKRKNFIAASPAAVRTASPISSAATERVAKGPPTTERVAKGPPAPLAWLERPQAAAVAVEESSTENNDVGGNIILPGVSVRRRKYRSRKMVQRRNRKTRRN